jgi:hypothetical protein
MIDDQRTNNEPDTPSPAHQQPIKINLLATAQLNPTREWTRPDGCLLGLATWFQLVNSNVHLMPVLICGKLMATELKVR